MGGGEALLYVLVLRNAMGGLCYISVFMAVLAFAPSTEVLKGYQIAKYLGDFICFSEFKQLISQGLKTKNI